MASKVEPTPSERTRLTSNEESQHSEEDPAEEEEENPTNGYISQVHEDAMSKVGFGKYTFYLVCLMGLCSANELIAVLISSFILPDAKDEMKLSDFTVSALEACEFAGRLIGAIFLCSLSDRYGRRTMLMCSLLFTFCGNVFSQGVSHAWLFIICRFFTGIGSGSLYINVLSFLCEIVASANRGLHIGIMNTFWAFGGCFAPIIAWATIPVGQYQLTYPEHGATAEFIASWRVYIVFAIIPILIGLVGVFHIDESPRYLLENGRYEEAMVIYVKMAMWNDSKEVDELVAFLQKTISRFRKEDMIISQIKQDRNAFIVLFQEIGNVFVHNWSSAKEYVRDHQLVVIMATVILFCQGFGLYATITWIPLYYREYFKPIKFIQHHHNLTGVECVGVQICENVTQQPPEIPVKHGHETTIYLMYFYGNLSNAVVTMFVGWLVDRLGRKFWASFFYLILAVSVIFYVIVKNDVALISVHSLVTTASSCALNVIETFCIEFFPTKYRSTVNGHVYAVAQVGGIMASVVYGNLVHASPLIPIIFTSAISLIGGVVGVFLPESRNILI